MTAGEGAESGATGAVEARRGRKTRKVVDQPGESTMSMKPSWASAIDLAMTSATGLLFYYFTFVNR